MKTVTVTGGIGSGKSTVCSILGKRGVPVYDSDSAAKRLYVTDDALLDSIEEAFGCSVRTSSGAPDLKKIASIVFSSNEKLKLLESIVHLAVLKDFKRWNGLQSARYEDEGDDRAFFGNEPFCVLESAIILDKPEFLSYVDSVVLVDAPLQLRLKRACERDGSDTTEVLRRMALQRFDLSKVDAIIRNDGTEEELAAEVNRVFKELKMK